MKKKTKNKPFQRKKKKKAGKAHLPVRTSPTLGRDEKTIDGTFRGTLHGYGFVDCPDLTEDIFIPADKTAGALDGDLVRVSFRERPSYDRRRLEGRIVKILDVTSPYIIGTVIEYLPYHQRRKGHAAPSLVLIPDNSRLAVMPTVEGEGVQPNDKVMVMLTARPRMRGDGGTCRLVTNYGPAESREANYQAILADCGVPTDFSEEAAAEAEVLARRPLSSEGRVRRRETIFTIDGADAKDLDDAVSVSRLPGGLFKLGVHIADVSEYVTPKSALDEEALLRGTSLYFVDQVVPMLPRALSNGACSLNAGEDKYTLSAIMTIGKQGEILDVKLEKSIIRSCVRGVYSEVNDLLSNGKASPYYEKYKRVHAPLLLLKSLTARVKKHRRQGMLELDRPEARFILDEKGHPTEIVRRERGEAERIIEECMLLANEAVATYLRQNGRPCVYRVHGAPTEEKLSDFLRFAHNRGIDVSDIKPPYPSEKFKGVLAKAADMEISEPVSYLLLRAMEKARYSEVPTGHYGIGLALYAHFTSPIRRLSDLATHRIVSEMLRAPNVPSKLTSYAHRAAEAASNTEVRALTAERRIEALYKTLYLADRIGQTYDARITSVNAYGMFAELPNTCEGLIPVEALGDYVEFDEDAHELHTAKKVYRIGDLVRIRIEDADIAASRVTFALLKDEGPKKERKGRAAAR